MTDTLVRWETRANLGRHVRTGVDARGGVPRVFDPDRRPWIDADAAEPQPDSTLFVRGRIQIVDACRLIREDRWVALCRCGVSANKPCRDGSHRRIDFRSVLEEVEAVG